MTLLEQTQTEFRPLVGQRVEFMYQGSKHFGVLDFAGVNGALHGQFQVTVSRTPYWPVNPKSLKLSPL
jgi:hypothetical protein